MVPWIMKSASYSPRWWACPLYPGCFCLRAPPLWCKVAGGGPGASSLKPVAASVQCCRRRFKSRLFAAWLVTAASSLCCHPAVPRPGQSPRRPECGLCTPRPRLLCKGCSPNPAPAARPDRVCAPSVLLRPVSAAHSIQPPSHAPMFGSQMCLCAESRVLC